MLERGGEDPIVVPLALIRPTGVEFSTHTKFTDKEKIQVNSKLSETARSTINILTVLSFVFPVRQFIKSK